MAKAKLVDYYEMFELDRTMTEKELKKVLGRKSVEVTKLEGSTDPNDTQTRKELQEVRQIILEAIKILGKAASRKAYDAELDEAIRKGTVSHEKTQEVQDALARARKYFEESKYELSLEYAREALRNGGNDEEPHEIIGRSLFMLGDYQDALDALDNAGKSFQNSVSLWWLRIRFRIMMECYDAAQKLIYQAMIQFSGDAQFAAEQAHLYFHAGKDDAGNRVIEEYLSRHPNDMRFRQYVAYNLIETSNMYYKYDSSADVLLITEESNYKECLKLITMANQYYQDDYTKSALENIKKFGAIEYDPDNVLMRKAYIGVGIAGAAIAILMLLGGSTPIVGMLIAAFGFLGVKVVDGCSYRPCWQGYRDYYRGYKEKNENWLFSIVAFPFDLAMGWLDSYQ